MIRTKLDSFYNYVFKQNELPSWIVYLNLGSLLGILVWPLIFFMSIFIFDNPQNERQAYFIFILSNCYPFLLMLLTYCSYKLFRVKNLPQHRFLL